MESCDRDIINKCLQASENHSNHWYETQLKVKTAIYIIEDDGWYLVRTRGSHRQYKHPAKPGLVTIAGKLSDDLASGTANSILKQAQLKSQKIAETDREEQVSDQDNLEELN